MLKFSPISYKCFLQATTMNVEYAGAEANVAVSLANYGQKSIFVSKLPDNDFGEAAINALRQFGVDVSNVVRGGDRIGIYFVEKGASQRPSKVIYDRKGSAIACAETKDFDWELILDGADWFHITGITPALSGSLATICLEACRVAKVKGLMISCDLNYRKKLWGREKAREVMSQICKYVDVCICNEEDASEVFGVKSEQIDLNFGKVDEQSYESVAKQLRQMIGCKYVAITLRESISASDNNWSAILYDGCNIYNSKKYAIHIVDRIGGGDAFGAGLIYGLIEFKDAHKALEFAVAASCLQQTIEGDINLAKVCEVLSLMEGNESGRIQR